MRTLLLAAALCLVPTLAHAESSVSAKTAPATQWYGWQPMVADLGAATVTGAAIGLGDSRYAPVGATYLVAAPVVHLAHRRWDAAGASLFVRTAFPLAGVALARSSCDAAGCSMEAGNKGLLIGMGLASLLDASLLSWEATPQPKTETMTSTRVVPTASFSSQGMSLGLSGIF